MYGMRVDEWSLYHKVRPLVRCTQLDNIRLGGPTRIVVPDLGECRVSPLNVELSIVQNPFEKVLVIEENVQRYVTTHRLWACIDGYMWLHGR